MPKNTTQCPPPGLDAGPLAPEEGANHWHLFSRSSRQMHLFASVFNPMCFVIDQHDYLCCSFIGIQLNIQAVMLIETKTYVNISCETCIQKRKNYFKYLRNKTSNVNIYESLSYVLDVRSCFDVTA